MAENLIATSMATLNVPVAKVWNALVDPTVIKQYMFGTDVVSDWQQGSPILWKGVWKGKPYEDKGVILNIVPEQTLQYTHYSPVTGEPDVPENYHTVTFRLTAEGKSTHIALSQDGNKTQEEVDHSRQMWDSMLVSLKKLLEG